jgi:hypothetical protein
MCNYNIATKILNNNFEIMCFGFKFAASLLRAILAAAVDALAVGAVALSVRSTTTV